MFCKDDRCVLCGPGCPLLKQRGYKMIDVAYIRYRDVGLLSCTRFCIVTKFGATHVPKNSDEKAANEIPPVSAQEKLR